MRNFEQIVPILSPVKPSATPHVVSDEAYSNYTTSQVPSPATIT
jgi:hypothetical protein